MRRLLALIAAAGCVVSCLCTVPVSAEEVSTGARAFVLYCPDNGEVLLSDNADERLPMASTTKILTALIALEYAAEDNSVVEFTQEMTAEGSSMYLKVGEKVTLYDLAVGMLMQSGNDAANAAAIALSGSVEDFAVLMNEKAQQIGMTDSRFVTPSGLDDCEHYATAYDMALLMAYAMENDDFRAMTSQTSMTVDFTSPGDKSVTYPNHNRLLSMYEYCVGGKTGYTDAAGRCLVTAAEKDGLRLVAVTLDDGDDWRDHIALYDYGFSRYTAVKPDRDMSYAVDVVGGAADGVSLSAEPADNIVIEYDSKVQRTVYIPRFVYAPIDKGDELGRVIYSVDGEEVLSVPLLAQEDIAYNDRRRGLLEYIKDIINWQS